MVKRFGYVALVGLAAVWPMDLASAEHDHHDHRDGHGSGFGIHFDSGGVGIHYGGHHDDHWDATTTIIPTGIIPIGTTRITTIRVGILSCRITIATTTARIIMTTGSTTTCRVLT